MSGRVGVGGAGGTANGKGTSWGAVDVVVMVAVGGVLLLLVASSATLSDGGGDDAPDRKPVAAAGLELAIRLGAHDARRALAGGVRGLL